VWSDDEWQRLAKVLGIDDPALAGTRARLARVDDVEELVGAWTRTRTPVDVAGVLQAEGIEAVPVADFGDLHDDPQYARRRHFEPHSHPYLGAGLYERNGFRIDGVASGYGRAGPTIGEHTDAVLTELLGMDAAEIVDLRASGALE
jgi:crotonobetainyl-CoA:carnitine CoA-transferase CaiB-like acyl-CoA transferase